MNEFLQDNINLNENIAIKLTNVYKKYLNQMILNNVNLSFQKNKVTVILGPSGCGKTTLLNIISGIEKYDSGNLYLSSNNISYMFQENTLFPWMNVYQNIEFVLKSKHKKKSKDIVEKYLNLVELENCKYKSIDELSGGMKRRVAMARAISYDSDILLMDEPFEGLDNKLKTNIINKLLKLWDNKKTVILVTHNTEEAKLIGDTFINFSQIC